MGRVMLAAGAVLLLLGCATPEQIVRTVDLGAPGPSPVTDERWADGCRLFYPSDQGRKYPVLWAFSGGVSAADEDLVRHWASHGIPVVATQTGEMTDLIDCYQKLPPTMKYMYAPGGKATYVGSELNKLGKGVDVRRGRLLIVGGFELGDLPHAFTPERMADIHTDVLLLTGGRAEGDERAFMAGLPQSESNAWAAKRGPLTDEDIRRVSTSWFFLYQESLNHPDPMFGPPACELCRSRDWTLRHWGYWKPRPEPQESYAIRRD